MPKQNEMYKSIANGRIFYIEDVIPETNEVRTCTVGSGLRRTIRLDRLNDRKRFKKIQDDYRWL